MPLIRCKVRPEATKRALQVALDRAARAPEPALPAPLGWPIEIIWLTAARARLAMSGATWTSSRPSWRQRSRAAGVIIFM